MEEIPVEREEGVTRRIGLIISSSNRKAGYDVIHARGFALKGSDEYCATPAEFWRDRAIEAARPEADADLVSCANISVFPVIAEIEQKLGRPAVTSNQAVIFHALSLLGAAGRRVCPGRLFDSLGRTEPARKVHA